MSNEIKFWWEKHKTLVFWTALGAGAAVTFIALNRRETIGGLQKRRHALALQHARDKISTEKFERRLAAINTRIAALRAR